MQDLLSGERQKKEGTNQKLTQGMIREKRGEKKQTDNKNACVSDYFFITIKSVAFFSQ